MTIDRWSTGHRPQSTGHRAAGQQAAGQGRAGPKTGRVAAGRRAGLLCAIEVEGRLPGP